MTPESIELVKQETLRLMKAINALQSRRDDEAAKEQEGSRVGRMGGYLYDFQGCAESAAVRRASMDLTRALARMRRP